MHVLGVTTNPDGRWTTQQARNLLSISTSARRLSSASCGTGRFTAAFDAVLADTGIEVLKTPARRPRANAHAERFVLTARTELTDRMLIFGEHHLRHVLDEYARHNNERRPHRSRRLRPPRPTTRPPTRRPTARHPPNRAGRTDQRVPTRRMMPDSGPMTEFWQPTGSELSR